MLFILRKRPLSRANHILSNTLRDFVSRFIPVEDIDVLVENSSERFELSQKTSKKIDSYLDLENLNNCKSIRNYFQSVNEHLNIDGLFMAGFETHNQKIASQKINKIPVLKTINKGFEFMFHRVMSKIKGLRHVYNLITQRRNRRLTKTEVLGRLIRAGFSIVSIEENIEGKLFFVAKKATDEVGTRNPGFGLLYKMPRVGMKGEIIHVYKFRTMHPFAEYLQGYIYENHGTTDGDKLINDFRVSKWGRIMRKYWIDELPMIINLFKRDIKLVGIRPLSKHKFETYPDELQTLRVKTKPGLFPPYYADLPKNQADFFKSEEKYLRAYLKSGSKVDRKYLSMCLKNIVLKRKRSA
jgi:hypothetical protein